MKGRERNTGERLRVLAVDDEPRGVDLIGRTLRRLATTDSAARGEEAWNLFREKSYDVVISDQRMPGMTGVELLERVASAAPYVGRILLTGYADLEATVDAINRGRVHAYINKPCPPDHLRTVVTTVASLVSVERENSRLIAELVDRNDELEEVIASLRCEREKAVVMAAENATLSLREEIDSTLGSLETHARRILSEASTGSRIAKSAVEELVSYIREARCPKRQARTGAGQVSEN